MLSVSQALHAGTAVVNASPSQADIHKSLNHYVTLLYSDHNTLQVEIATKISHSLLNNNKNIVLSDISYPDNSSINKHTELVIVIGQDNIDTANQLFPDTGKLLIASVPSEYKPDSKSSNNNALLYMSQPYCRQIKLIKLINPQWHTFSYLSSDENAVNDSSIQQCARKLEITAYKVVASEKERLTDYLKRALSHSELILAIPDKEIYNSKSVKNILLTSYRDRKPIIAFSQNFVNAGALAAIYSDTGQIADSAAALVDQYLATGGNFKKQVNYPGRFNIDINNQVFRALDLEIPDIPEIKRIIENSESSRQGRTR